MAIQRIQQQDLVDLPLINLVLEQVSNDLGGADLINGKLVYQLTKNELQTVVSNTIAKIMTSQDIAIDSDLVNKTLNKILTSDKVAITGDTVAIVDEDKKVATVGFVRDVAAKSTDFIGVFDLVAQGGSIEMRNITGSASYDALTELYKGKEIRIVSEGTLTVNGVAVYSSNNTLTQKVYPGEVVIILNDVQKTTMVSTDVRVSGTSESKASTTAFDNTGSNLTSTNVESALKEVNLKIANGVQINGLVFAAGEIKTITHNLNSSAVSVHYSEQNQNTFKEAIASPTNRTNNSFEIQIDVAGTYDFIVSNLIKS